MAAPSTSQNISAPSAQYTAASSTSTLSPPGSAADDTKDVEESAAIDDGPQFRPTLPFWLIIGSLMLVVLCANTQWYAATNTLPQVAAELGEAHAQWVYQAYRIAYVAASVISGAAAEAFGRRPSLLAMLLLFMVGCAICGAAPEMWVLILGSSVQGFASGAMLALPFLIVADLTPLSRRGIYNGFLTATFFVGGGLGPLLGGALDTHWRWMWWTSLILSGIAFVLCFCFLRLKHPQGKILQQLRTIDWIGNIMLVGALVSVCLGLTRGGTEASWDSATVLVPLIVGLAGLIAWLLYEKTLDKPTVPFQIWRSKTTGIGLAIEYLSRLMADTIVTSMPLYFQILGDSPFVAAVKLIVFNVVMDGTALATGFVITWLGRYKLVIIVGCVLFTFGSGCLAGVSNTDAAIAWVGAFIVCGLAVGMLETNAPRFAVLAPLPPSLNAPAISIGKLMGSLGSLTGQVVGGAILQNELQRHLPDAARAALLPSSVNEAAYAIVPILGRLDAETVEGVKAAFRSSYKLLWLVYVGIGGLQLLLSLFVRDIPLSHQTDENWDLSRKPADQQVA